jgi:hypothetical protein
MRSLVAELLTTTEGSRITVHPWYQIIKHRLSHIELGNIIIVPNVAIAIDDDSRKQFEQEGMLVPIIIDETNLLVEGAKRLQYFKNIGTHGIVYQARSIEEENFLKKLNEKCFHLHPNIFDWKFMFEKDMRELTLKVLPLLQEGIQNAKVK